MSCLHTPEQNGAVEGKHHHIVDTGLTLLAQAGMPLTYCVEAFNAAVHLIYRLPTKLFNFVSPYEKLFHRSPDYLIH